MRSGTAPPRWTFHAVVLIPMAYLLWGASTPQGGSTLLAIAAVLALLLAAVMWGAALLAWVIARVRGRAMGSGWWFVIAPLAGLLFVGALAGNVPLRARWFVSLPSLDRIVADGPSSAGPDDVVSIEVPDRVGLYRVDGADRVGANTFVYVAAGSSDGVFLTGAGFAHLPDGPSWDLYPGGDCDRVEYDHLGGDWYSWACYW